MTRPPRPVLPVKLPLFDYEGHAARLVKRVREGETVVDVIASAESFARDVRDIECAREAARVVGLDADLIRKNCPVAAAVIARYQQDCGNDFGPGKEFTDRKLARFLTGMYRDLRAAQVAEAVREAAVRAAEAEAAQDDRKAAAWRKAEANLEAMRLSITGGGFVPVPCPRE